jgi:hypothetical protein
MTRDTPITGQSLAPQKVSAREEPLTSSHPELPNIDKGDLLLVECEIACQFKKGMIQSPDQGSSIVTRTFVGF